MVVTMTADASTNNAPERQPLRASKVAVGRRCKPIFEAIRKRVCNLMEHPLRKFGYER